MARSFLSPIEYTLCSSDGKFIKASKTVLQASAVLDDLIKDFSNSSDLKGALQEAIPLETIKYATLERVISWCTFHAHPLIEDLDPGIQKISQEWSRKFFHIIDIEGLFDLIRAANFLEVNTLLESSCQELGRLIPTKTLYLLNGLPDEMKAKVAPYFDPYTLQLAAKIGAVPLTPGIMKKAQHAHIWANFLSQEDFKGLKKVFEKGGDAYLIGWGLKYFKNLNSSMAIPRDKSPIHILLAWKKRGPKPKLMAQKTTKEPFNQIIGLQNSPIVLHVATTSDFIFVDDLGKFIDLDTSRTNIISFQHAELPFDSKLNNVNQDSAGTYYYVDCPGAAAEDEDLRIIHQTTQSQKKEGEDWYKKVKANKLL